MLAHCDDRVLSGPCFALASDYYLAVLPFDVDVSPAAVKLRPLHSNQCADVYGSWYGPAPLLQYVCGREAASRISGTSNASEAR